MDITHFIAHPVQVGNRLRARVISARKPPTLMTAVKLLKYGLGAGDGEGLVIMALHLATAS
ncbi:hypothetical protein [Rhizobium sp. BE258]|uniref:hypothetical protein n=1 Tax=Rhizobium sp. BE258 TaxID=2817722 RepID=UPI0013AEDE96|nr:hypothetical protein [Rhizobium sp. BE258]MDR7145253.1 hypothetical protein [Rhizobium sp. BE258]